MTELLPLNVCPFILIFIKIILRYSFYVILFFSEPNTYPTNIKFAFNSETN